MLHPDPRRLLRCHMCGLEVDTRVARYVFLLVADRGRGGLTMKPDTRAVLCGPCGDTLRGELEGRGLLGLVCHG